MKPRHAIRLVALCGIFASTAVFGQTVYTWTGAGDGISLANSTNWDPNGLPSGNNGSAYALPSDWDFATWDGRTTTNQLVTYGSTSLPATGFGSSGINLQLTSNQTKPVTIISSVTVSAGVGINYITIDPGAGAFALGDDGANRLKAFGRPAGGIHLFTNNSTNAASIGSSVEWQAGGGAGYTYEFGGTGDWIVHSYLYPDNGAFSPTIVQVDGPGTMYWSAGVIVPNSPAGTVAINGGALVLKTSGLFPGAANQSISNMASLVFDAPAQAQTLRGVIFGTGTLTVTNGTLTLSGQSTYSGNTILSGGELVVGGAEDTNGAFGPLGVGGLITFKGGTLGFSVNNVVDYSGRFDPAAGQAYSIDTGGQDVTFTNGLTSSGGTFTKLGSGTLTLAGANTYSGDTTVSAGQLLLAGTKTGTGNITVGDGAILGVTATGTQVTPAALTVGTSGSATLGFNNVNSTTTALIAAGTVSAAAPIAININSGNFTPGQSYPLLSWTSGSAPDVDLAVLNGYIGTLSTNGNTIQVNITGTAYTWTAANSSVWDTSTINWLQNGAPAAFANGGPVLFDDTASATSVTISGVVQPTSVTVNNSAKAYSIASSAGNDIGGSASLTKINTGTLSLSGGANSYTGPTAVNGGILSVGALANGGAASDIGAASSSADNLVINGGALQYTGTGASIDRLFTLGTGGATIENAGSGALAFNGTGPLGYSGVGPRALTLTGVEADNNTIAGNLVDNGGPTSLTKNGVGKWVLSGTNTYSGGTTIAAGTLQIGAGGASGAVGSGGIVNNAGLDFNRTGTLSVSGAISGTGSVTNDGTGTVVLAANNTYTGGTTINAGTLQIGSGGSSGTLDANSFITDNGTLIFNSSAAFTLNAGSTITGSGALIKRGSGLLMLRGTESYNGGTLIDSGAQLQIFSGNEGNFSGAGTITNNGTLIVVRQDNGVAGITNNIIGTGKLVKDSNNPNNGDVTLAGTNSYTGGTFINGGGIILGDGVTPGSGAIVGNVTMTNFSLAAGNPSASSLTFNRVDDFTFPGNITGPGSVVQSGFGTVTLTGTNTYSAGTTINNGNLQVGNGGTTGSVGTGNISVTAGSLIWNRSDDVSFAGDISGSGQFVKTGAGALTLLTNTFAGFTSVSNGTLILNGDNGASVIYVYGGGLGGTGTVAASVTTYAGSTLTPGASAGAVGTFTINNGLDLSGDVTIDLNKSLTPSNDLIASPVGVNNSGTGTVTVFNRGPALAVGDKFTLFSVPVQNGAALTVTGAGATWANNLASDGSITALTVTAPPGPTNITFSVSGNVLTMSWPASHLGWVLQAQTNTLAAGLSGNWVDIAGSGSTTQQVVNVNLSNPTVFYRLRSP